MMGRRSEEIDEQAAKWAAKIAGGDLTPDERASFDSWYAADIRHVGAFARSQAILLRVGRLRAIGADALRASIPDKPAAMLTEEPQLDMPESGDDTPVLDAPAHRPPVWSRRRVVATGSIAASFAAVGIIGVALVRNWPPRRRSAVPEPKRFATRLGETRSVRLADGSVVTLNTNSRVSVSYTEAMRSIRLDHGEALFKVAKNKTRPFIVTAANTVVRAVGTSFAVSYLPERPVQVLVQEGVVEVTKQNKPESRPVRVKAETQTVVDAAGPITVQSVPRVRVDRELAWRHGQLAFENKTLAAAAEEFGRYSNTKIVVDPAVASRTITGMYASNDPVGFAKAAASVLDLHVEVEPNEVWIVR